MTDLRVRLVLLLAMGLATCGLVSPAEAQFDTPSRQFHSQTGFPLDGRHRDLSCESCHRGAVFQGTPTRCFDCHWTRRQDDRYRLQLGSQCEQCHRTTSWTDVRWDHGAMTSMPLGVAHRQVACASCHANNTFRAAQVACVSCHLPDYQAALMPNHAAAGFPTACEACHRVNDATFQGAAFNHNSVFALVGRHAQTTCATCHTNNVFRGTPRDCIGCHRAQYDRTTAPNHAAAGFSMQCESCHRPTDASFQGAGFNHSSVFALVGRHAQTACATCHTNNVFKGTPRDCIGCHRAQYDRTTAPNHAAAGFSMQCESCHRATDSSFRGASFNHNSVFALAGRHAQVSCASCHGNGVYKGTPRTCVGCHQGNYDRTSSPNHRSAGFPTTCESCHKNTDTSWTQGVFTHRFPITSGPHRTACASCHTSSGSFATFNCLTCHQRAKTDEQHKERRGYRYESVACYGCHPTGRD
jgi:hypothetical protein